MQCIAEAFLFDPYHSVNCAKALYVRSSAVTLNKLSVEVNSLFQENMCAKNYKSTKMRCLKFYANRSNCSHLIFLFGFFLKDKKAQLSLTNPRDAV